MLIINFAMMHPLPSLNTSSSNIERSPERKTMYVSLPFFLIPSSFSKRQNQYYEVAEQSTIETKVHKLDTIYNFVQNSWNLCSELQEKLHILGAV